MAKTSEKDTKVKRPTPQKRDLQNEKRRLRNKVFTSSVKTAIRAFEESLNKKDASLSEKNLNEVYSLMDKGVNKGIFSLNKASRTKSRLTARAFAKA